MNTVTIQKIQETTFEYFRHKIIIVSHILPPIIVTYIVKPILIPGYMTVKCEREVIGYSCSKEFQSLTGENGVLTTNW